MEINVVGEIVSDEWGWVYDLFAIPHFCPQQVREAIKNLPPGEELTLVINSPGGDVWAGFEIYGLLQACRAHTEAHISPLAASAATTIMVGCDTVLASPVAQVMIHQPAVDVRGSMDNEDARRLQNLLDSVKASILNGYVIKSAGKASRKKFEQLVDESTWMPAQEALALGLIDGYLDVDDEAAATITAGGALRVTNAAGLSPTPKALLDRYEAAVRAGTMDEVRGHPVARKPTEGADAPAAAIEIAPANTARDWRLMAAVRLERARNAV